jgi:riboflavin kinase/FMN adenylyltransferase
VIRQALAEAVQHEGLAVVVTFDRHPNTVVAPDRVPPLIYSLPQKLRAIAALGVHATWLVHFDEAFSRQTGEEFVRGLARDLGRLQSVCVGNDFTFGCKRSGNIDLLHRLGDELRFSVRPLAAVSLDGQGVSSTRIREAIRGGDLDAATQMLGRQYSVAGKVMRGDQLGTKLGFPTANVDVRGLVLPPNGVYAARVLLEGNPRRAVVNLGVRPTLNRPTPSVQLEAHLLDFVGDLYDKELEVCFAEKLRMEMKFPSLERLQAQIAQDIQQARALFD